jgi:hypothetical protein
MKIHPLSNQMSNGATDNECDLTPLTRSTGPPDDRGRWKGLYFKGFLNVQSVGTPFSNGPPDDVDGHTQNVYVSGALQSIFVEPRLSRVDRPLDPLAIRANLANLVFCFLSDPYNDPRRCRARFILSGQPPNPMPRSHA